MPKPLAGAAMPSPLAGPSRPHLLPNELPRASPPHPRPLRRRISLDSLAPFTRAAAWTSPEPPHRTSSSPPRAHLVHLQAQNDGAQDPDATVDDDSYYTGGAYYYVQPADDDQE
ncbi:hypothetical protein ACQJBY_036202 [Aegilops geniculata]